METIQRATLKELGKDMRRIAFIGIEHADDAALHEALRKNIGPDSQIKVFGHEDVVDAARFLVSVNAETKSLDGSNSVAYISDSVSEAGARRVNKLAKVGVTVKDGWADYKVGAPNEEIAGWLRNGEWAAPKAPEPVADIFESFFDDDDEPEAQPAPAVDVSEDDIPVFRAPVREENPRSDEKLSFVSRSFDSMSANETPAPPVSRRAAEPVHVDDEDEDFALPAFVPPSEQRRATPPVSSYEAPAVDNYDDADDLPTFAAPRAAAVEDRRPVVVVDDEDDLPTFRAPQRDAPREAVRELPRYEAPSRPAYAEEEAPLSRRAAREQRREMEAPEESEDDLPVFRAPEQVAPSRPSYSVPDDSDEDDLPTFAAPRPVQREEPVAQRPVRQEPARPVYEEDDDNDLPVFNPAPVQRDEPEVRRAPRAVEPEPVRRQARQEPVANDDDDDDFVLPAFNAAPAQRAEPEVRRAPREAEPARRQARQEPVAQSADADDDDDFGLPVFTPAAPRAVEPERARRAPEPVQEDEDDDGDDLPVMIARPAAPSKASKRPAKEEDEDDFGFTFAPKTQSVTGRTPARRSWEAPEKREVNIAPEKVRYENDNPSEMEERRIRRGIELGEIDAPKLPHDTQNVRVKPEPGSVSDGRRPQRVVNQRPAAPVESDDEDDDIEFAVDNSVVRERPVIAPPVKATGIDDAFDPDAPAPYLSQLEPEAQRAQNTMEQIIKDYDSESIFKAKSKKQAVSFYVTGSHGGAGKTTSTWMMANTVAAALKKDPSRPVFLIEADYENSKLAQRLNMPPERNSGKLAEFFRTVSADRSTVVKQRFNMFELTEKIIQESIYVNDRGVNIIACPYDLTKRDGRFLRMAIQRSVEYAERQGGYVFIDADTLSNDDILDRTLAAKATHVVVVSFGDQDHVEDTQRAIHTLVTPNMKAVAHNQSTNGMGVPKDRIKVFFNKTGAERYTDLQQIMLPYLVDGHLPTVQGLNEGGWIGNLNGGDFPNVVTSYAAFVNRISPMEELRPYQMRRPQKATQRAGFMKIFGKR